MQINVTTKIFNVTSEEYYVYLVFSFIYLYGKPSKKIFSHPSSLMIYCGLQNHFKTFKLVQFVCVFTVYKCKAVYHSSERHLD